MKTNWSTFNYNYAAVEPTLLSAIGFLANSTVNRIIYDDDTLLYLFPDGHAILWQFIQHFDSDCFFCGSIPYSRTLCRLISSPSATSEGFSTNSVLLSLWSLNRYSKVLTYKFFIQFYPEGLKAYTRNIYTNKVDKDIVRTYK
jgi:hypothetical protein